MMRLERHCGCGYSKLVAVHLKGELPPKDPPLNLVGDSFFAPMARAARLE
jgi:hypothetical protein